MWTILQPTTRGSAVLPPVFLSGNLESNSQLSSTTTRDTRFRQVQRGGEESRGSVVRLTVTAPLQACDLQLQAGQHGQVLLLQEGHPSPHTGHLLLQLPLIHGCLSACRCCWLEGDFSYRMTDLRFEKRNACMLSVHLHCNHKDCARLRKTLHVYYARLYGLVYFNANADCPAWFLHHW